MNEREKLLEVLGNFTPTEPARPNQAMTRREIAEALGLSRDKSFALLRTLSRQGVIRPVKISLPTIAGHLQKTTAYELVPEGERDVIQS